MNTPSNPAAGGGLTLVHTRGATPLPRPPVWVLLWSQSQNALHVETVDDMLTANRKAYSEDRRMDYVPVCIGPEDVVRQMADAIRNTVHTRELNKAEKRELV